MMKTVVDCGTGTVAEVPLTPEELADMEQLAAEAATRQRVRRLETSEDDERLALIAERAAGDPAFAALAELALKGG